MSDHDWRMTAESALTLLTDIMKRCPRGDTCACKWHENTRAVLRTLLPKVEAAREEAASVSPAPAITKAITRLEDEYDFQCRGGPLKNCIDWQVVREAARAAPVASTETFVAQVKRWHERHSDSPKSFYVVGNMIVDWERMHEAPAASPAPTAIRTLLQELVDRYMKRQPVSERHGGCGWCGGLPHSVECLVGHAEAALIHAASVEAQPLPEWLRDRCWTCGEAANTITHRAPFDRKQYPWVHPFEPIQPRAVEARPSLADPST